MSPRVRSTYLRRIERRLADDELELAQLHRMSADELELMVKMERGWGPSTPSASTRRPAVVAA